MTQEEKSLWLKDLCARVPYHPKGHVVNAHNGAQCDEWLTCATFPMFTSIINNSRLYLRPMSSMTDEEYDQLYIDSRVKEDSVDILDALANDLDAIDWLNAHHFDYRGLIEKGLAIKVTEENNPYKE